MDTQTLTNIIVSTLSLITLGYIVFIGYQRYRIDRFRHKVFVLRDRLFDDAASGVISFDHAAYQTLRLLMNGHLQYAHHLSLWIPFIHFLFDKFNGPIRKTGPSFDEIYATAVADLTPEAKAKLDVYRNQLEALVMRHIFFALPEFVVLTIPLFLVSLGISLVRMLFHSLLGSTKQMMEGFTQSRIDNTAYDLGVKTAKRNQQILSGQRQLV